jgi:hypothetical protein
MSENVSLNSMSGGDTCAADDIDGVKYQRMKITIGSNGVNDGDVEKNNPLPIVQICYSEQIYFDGSDIYMCKALPGSILSDPIWQVIKYNTTSDISGRYANGAATFINRATNLETVKGLSYS